MILTKAYITKTPDEGDNIFQVNVPFMTDNVNDEALFDALLCTSAGGYKDFNVGDCVFINFEDDKYNTAIILGKLFIDVPESNAAYGLFDELKVTGTVRLPDDTRIGKYSPQDIFDLYQAISNINVYDLEKIIDWDNLENFLKQYASKKEFNTFFGETYFSDDFPYSENITFNNTLETGEDSKKIYNKNYNPNFKTLRNDFINFLKLKLNALYGLSTSGDSIPSIMQIVSKMSATDSQSFTINNITNINDPKSPIKESYFPNYSTLIDNLKKFFNNFPTIISNFKTFINNEIKDVKDEIEAWVEAWVNEKTKNFVSWLSGSVGEQGPAKKIVVMDGASYPQNPDKNTLYLLTSPPDNE